MRQQRGAKGRVSSAKAGSDRSNEITSPPSPTIAVQQEVADSAEVFMAGAIEARRLPPFYFPESIHSRTQLTVSTQKTVYILGAGFSIPGGGPRQDEIISEIWKLPDEGDAGTHKEAFQRFLR